MGIIIDVIVILIIALSIFLGYRKGLISLAIKLFAVIIALIATLILYKPISALIINNTSLDENIQNAIIEKSTSSESTTNSTSNEANENTNSNTTIETQENNLIKESINEKIVPEVAKELSINIINVAVIIILYFAIKIALHFVTAIANIVAKIPIIKQFNKIGGVIYGLLRGLLLIYVILLIISFVGEINPENQLHKQINQSLLTKEMYQNNILNILIK